MWRLDDYACSVEDCSEKDKRVEVFHKRSEEPECEVCGEVMQRKVSGIKCKHPSWSTWQIGVGKRRK